MLLLEYVVALDEVLVVVSSHSVKVRVRQALDGGEALPNLHSQHSIHQTQGLCAHFANIPFLQSLRLIQLRELEANEARIFIELFLEGLRQLAKDFLNTEELIYLRLTWKERIAVNDLAHDASDGPDVDFLAVVVAQQKFWGPVPARCHIVSQAGSL